MHCVTLTLPSHPNNKHEQTDYGVFVEPLLRDEQLCGADCRVL